MKRMILFFILITSMKMLGAGIEFTLANGTVNGGNYEFDIMVQGSASGTKIGQAIVFVNYNTTAFGEWIKTNSNITVSKGSLVNNAFYDIQVNDTDNNTFGVTVDYLLPGSPALGSDLSTSPTQWAHIIIQIADAGSNAGLSFNPSISQARESDNSTAYNPLTASDTDDSSLPVEMSEIQAESTVEGIEISWITRSEVNSRGFNVWRAQDADGTYERITTSLIASKGNTSEGFEYLFTDKNTQSEATYYYKVQQLDQTGSSEFFGPIQVKALFIPEEYGLSNNYPNPFNPLTTFSYDIPEVSQVQIRIYNLLGKEEKVLVRKQMMPGRYTETWDGTDKNNQKLASGVYFMRMQAGTYTNMKKLTLMR